MNSYDTLLTLHVLSAFAMVAAVVVFTVLMLAMWRVDRPSEIATLFRVAQPANRLVVVGSAAALVFGVWLAIYVDGYELWDGWILAALVLWAVATELGRRARAELRPWHWLRALVVLLILVDMIWKPGA